jgi:hypothetical protein
MDYNIEYEESCSKCGHSLIHSRKCSEINCEDGVIDESEEDYLKPGSAMVTCDECKGTGVERWCPACGENLSGTTNLDLDDPDDGFEDEDSWQPCADCDLPEACGDFGCAIKQGLRPHDIF